MDVIELQPELLELDNLNDMEPLNISTIDEFDLNDRPSINYGGGIEFLMNDKKNSNKIEKSGNIDIEDITKLEEDLNNMTKNIDKSDNIELDEELDYDKHIDNEKTEKKINFNEDNKDNNETKKGFSFNNLFGFGNKQGKNIKTVSENDKSKESNLGKASVSMNENKTWDGFGKFNNVPLSNNYQKPELTKEEELAMKFKYIKKFEEYEKKGIKLSKRYDFESDLNEMIAENECIISEREQKSSIKFQGKMLMAFITGVEFLNNKFDPFDVKLDGWAEQINENIEDYDDIFKELHEKYKSKAKMSPELKLLFSLGSSAVMVHMSNTIFKSAMPGMDDIMRQNPELMKQFTQAAVNTMGQSQPGFAGFMNGLMGSGGSRGTGRNDSGLGFGNTREMPPPINNGPPPEAVSSKIPDRSKRIPEFNNRPDIMEARGISLNVHGDPNNDEKILRPEMRGPSTNNQYNNMLNGLKLKSETKTVNKDSSTISVEDLNDLGVINAPKTKNKRRNNSNKNVVSLDI